MTDHLEDAKQQAEDLVATARRLVASAEAEAAAIVDQGQRRVEAILADAQALREAAQVEAHQLRAEAEALVDRARSGSHEPARSAASPAAAVRSDDSTIEQASAVADRILRVARSEAEARTRELIDAARRKAEQIEHDSRTKHELAIREHREALHRLQEQELETKARVRAAESQLELVQRKLHRELADAERRGIDAGPTPAAETAASNERVVLPSGIEFPKQQKPSTGRSAPAEPDERSDGEPTRTAPGRGADLPADDQDRLKALRAIRRRA